MLTFTYKIKKKWGSKESQMLMSMLHTIIPNQVVTTPRLSGGARVCNPSMTISLMQTRESYTLHFRPLANRPLTGYLNSILLCTPHTDCLLYLLVYIAATLLLGIHLKALTKTASGDQKSFVALFYLLFV